MKITRYLKSGQINLELEATDKRSALESLLKILADSGAVPGDKTGALLQSLLVREAQASTGLGYGIALPHVKTDAVQEIQIAFGRSDRGIDFGSSDGAPAQIFFLMLTPVQEACEHLKILSLIALLMRDKNNRRSLLRAKTPEDVFVLLNQTP